MSFWDSMRAGATATVDALQSTVVRVVRNVALKQDPDAEYDPQTPDLEEYDIPCVSTGVSEEYEKNELVIGSNKMLICEVYAVKVGGTGERELFEPTSSDEFVLTGKTQRVKHIERIPADGPAVLFLIFIAG